MDKIIESLKLKGVNTIIRLSTETTVANFYYREIFLGNTISHKGTLTDSLSDCLKDLEKHYIEKEMCWRLDVQLLSLKDDGRQAEVNRLIEDNDVALSTNEMMMKYGKI